MDGKTNIHQIQTLENRHYPRSNAKTSLNLIHGSANKIMDKNIAEDENYFHNIILL